MIRQMTGRLAGLTRLSRRQFCSSPEENFPARFEVKLSSEKPLVSERDIEAMFDYSVGNVEKISDHWDEAMEVVKKSEEWFPAYRPTERDLEKIRAARPTSTLASLVNDSETLQRLVDLGVELHHWDSRGQLGLAAKLDFMRDVAPTVQFLSDLGLHGADIANILTHTPAVLEEREEDLKARIAYLASKNFSRSEILEILSKSRAWLIFSVSGIDARLGFFQKTFDMSGTEVRQLTVAKPTLITWSGVPGKIKNHLFSYNEEMGFTPEELKGMTLSCPTLLMTNVKLKVIPQFELLHNEAKIPHSILVKFPQSLLASWIDTRARLRFLQSLGRDQFDPSLPNYINPELLTRTSDLIFCERAARCSLKLYDDYQRTLSLAVPCSTLNDSSIMDASYLKSQHPVVEELLTNKYFGDTLLVCANGHLTDNKLAVGLLFPCLLTSDIFALPIENVLLVPDYTMEEIGREFEKLIIGGNSKQLREQTERIEHDNSPAELVIDDSVDTIENGFDENCDNIEIGESNGETIEIFVNNEAPVNDTNSEEVTVVETDNIPPDIQVEFFTNTTNTNSDAEEETSETQNVSDKNSSVGPLDNNTDGDLYIMEKRAKSATVNLKNLKPKVWKQTKLKLKLEDDCQNVIENLPNLPDPEPEKTKEPSPKKSPKKESPILENRKPGRPRTKLDGQTSNRKLENGLTKFKAKSAEWVANEMFKCPICSKVLSCRGSYERHSRMHQNSKPFKCSFCPKTFREACKKNVHERIHSGSKPYPCPKCSKSFRTATQRIVHQRSHTKEKPFSCSVCGKVFSQPYSVKVHMEKFHK